MYHISFFVYRLRLRDTISGRWFHGTEYRVRVTRFDPSPISRWCNEIRCTLRPSRTGKHCIVDGVLRQHASTPGRGIEDFEYEFFNKLLN